MVGQHWGFGVMWPLAAACTLLGLAGLLADRHPGRSPKKTAKPSQSS